MPRAQRAPRGAPEGNPTWTGAATSGVNALTTVPTLSVVRMRSVGQAKQKFQKNTFRSLRPAPTVDTRQHFSMVELVATVSGADVKVWRPDSQVRAAGDSSDSLR